MAGAYTVMEHPKLKGKHRRQLVTTEQFEIIWENVGWTAVKQDDDPGKLAGEIGPEPKPKPEDIPPEPTMVPPPG